MRILFLTTHLNTGGITRYLYMLAKGLIARGHNVDLAASPGNMGKDFEEIGVRLKLLGIRTKSELDPRIYLALRPLKRHIHEHQIDVIHAQTRITQVMAHILARQTQRPFIATCHGFFKPRMFRRMFPLWGNRTIAISDAVKRHLIEDFHIAHTKIRVVSNGIDPNDFQPVSDDEKMKRRETLGLGTEKVIGIVARLSDVKGQDILIQAFAQVRNQYPDARLLLIGQGKFEKDLRLLVDKMHLTDEVRFIPDMNRSAYYISVLDVFVNPSRQEGLGIAVLEAQAMGVPVVASRVGGIPSLISHGKTGYLAKPEDVSDLAQQIERMLSQPDAAHMMAHKARENVLARHTADRMVDDTLAVYRKAMGR